MQTIILIGIIAECLLLLALALIKRLTGKVFVIISLATAIGCAGVAFIMDEDPADAKDETKIKGYIYMASRLIEEGQPEAALAALGQITEADGEQYYVNKLRVLAYNQNDMHDTGLYLLENRDDIESQELLSACQNKEHVSDEVVELIVQESINALDLSEDDINRFNAEMAIRYRGSKENVETTTEAVDNILLQIQFAVNSGDYETAYGLAAAKAKNGTIADDILISEMYIRNFNQNNLLQKDEAFDMLWQEVVECEIALYKATEEKEITKRKAEYSIAVRELELESAKRAINYLSYVAYEGTPYEIAVNLQLARLWHSAGQTDKAKVCLDQVFANKELNKEQRLATEVDMLREAYLNGTGNMETPEFDALYCQLMTNLYQGIFEESTSADFYEYVRLYLKGLYTGIYIGVPDLREYPKISVTLSTIGDFELSADSLILTDTQESISGFQITENEMEETDPSGKIYEINDGMTDGISTARIIAVSRELGIELKKPTWHSPNLYTLFVGMLERLDSYDEDQSILTFSDGVTGRWPRGMAAIINRMIAADIKVYAVGFPGCDENLLRDMATQTGGAFFALRNLNELKIAYDEIYGRYDHTYTLTYEIANEDVLERDICIEVADAMMQSRRQYTAGEDLTQYVRIDDVQASNFFKQIGGTLGGK